MKGSNRAYLLQKLFSSSFAPLSPFSVSPRGFYLPEICGMEGNAESNSSASREPLLDFEE